MDIATTAEKAPATEHTAATDACPSCGRPEDGSEQVVSRHPVSFGTVLYTRCPCGRLRVRTVRTGPPLIG